MDVHQSRAALKQLLGSRHCLYCGIGITRLLNARETAIKSLNNEFDIIFEATGNVEVSLEDLKHLGTNGVLCLLGIYRYERVCEEFGGVLTDMVLGNRLLFDSVNSNIKHFKKREKYEYD